MSFSASGKRAADVLLLTKSEESSLKPKLSQSPQTQVKRPRVADLESGDEGVEEKEMVQDDKECNNEAAEVGAAAEDEENENEKTGSVEGEEEQENAADHVEEEELEGEQAEESCIVQDFHDYQDKMRALMENVKNIFSEIAPVVQGTSDIIQRLQTLKENAVVATTNDLEDRRAENVSAHREMHTDIQDGMAVRLQHVGTPQAFTGI